MTASVCENCGTIHGRDHYMLGYADDFAHLSAGDNGTLSCRECGNTWDLVPSGSDPAAFYLSPHRVGRK